MYFHYIFLNNWTFLTSLPIKFRIGGVSFFPSHCCMNFLDFSTSRDIHTTFWDGEEELGGERPKKKKMLPIVAHWGVQIPKWGIMVSTVFSPPLAYEWTPFSAAVCLHRCVSLPLCVSVVFVSVSWRGCWGCCRVSFVFSWCCGCSSSSLSSALAFAPVGRWCGSFLVAISLFRFCFLVIVHRLTIQIQSTWKPMQYFSKKTIQYKYKNWKN